MKAAPEHIGERLAVHGCGKQVLLPPMIGQMADSVGAIGAENRDSNGSVEGEKGGTMPMRFGATCCDLLLDT
jgi:hypothetical protein